VSRKLSEKDARDYDKGLLAGILARRTEDELLALAREVIREEREDVSDDLTAARVYELADEEARSHALDETIDMLISELRPDLRRDDAHVMCVAERVYDEVERCMKPVWSGA